MSNAPGITLTSQIPPGYDVETEGNFDVAAGMLENGNQRYMLHRSMFW